MAIRTIYRVLYFINELVLSLNIRFNLKHITHSKIIVEYKNCVYHFSFARSLLLFWKEFIWLFRFINWNCHCVCVCVLLLLLERIQFIYYLCKCTKHHTIQSSYTVLNDNIHNSTVLFTVLKKKKMQQNCNRQTWMLTLGLIHQLVSDGIIIRRRKEKKKFRFAHNWKNDYYLK